MTTYRRVITRILEEIEAGQIGDRLPSTSKLAQEERVSQSIVNQAYRFLQERGFVEGHPGIGRFIVGKPNGEPPASGVG